MYVCMYNFNIFSVAIRDYPLAAHYAAGVSPIIPSAVKRKGIFSLVLAKFL